MDVNVSTFLEELAELLAEPSLTLETSLFDIEGWDSLNIVGFILLADRQYKQIVSPDAIGECQTVADLYSLCVNQASQPV